jgi:hypothetical protein
MNRDPAFIWAAEGLNTYLPPIGQDRPIEMTGGAFVSPSGLVYRHTDICVGTTDIQKGAWSDNKLSHLMASYGVESMMAFHLESDWLQEPGLFTLHYLSKVVQQNKKTPNASFWCKKTNGLLAAIHLFKWEKAQGRLLEYSEQTQAFAQTVVGRSCHGTRPVKADVDALREAGAVVRIISQGDGIPDLLVGYNGFTILMEVKDGDKVPSKRKLTEAEQKFFDEWEGGLLVVVNNVQEAIDMLKLCE